jgi:hypothetical protein
MNPLRSISVTVDEPEHGLYFWQLLEHNGIDWEQLKFAEQPAPTYAQAMAAGLLALQALIDDLDIGPREPDIETAAPTKRSLFGFGGLT